MESIFGRLTRIFIRYSVKIISLLLAVSIPRIHFGGRLAH